MNLQTGAGNPIADDGHRVAHRHKIFLPVRMTRGGGDHRIHLINISATGALAHYAIAPARGEVIGIEIGNRTIGARVIWAEGPRFGVAFAERLGQRTIDALFAG